MPHLGLFVYSAVGCTQQRSTLGVCCTRFGQRRFAALAGGRLGGWWRDCHVPRLLLSTVEMATCRRWDVVIPLSHAQPDGCCHLGLAQLPTRECFSDHTGGGHLCAACGSLARGLVHQVRMPPASCRVLLPEMAARHIEWDLVLKGGRAMRSAPVLGDVGAWARGTF